MKNVSGQTINYNATFGALSAVLMFDPETKSFLGLTVGGGPGATIIGGSRTVSATGTLTLRDFIKWLSSKESDVNCQ